MHLIVNCMYTTKISEPDAAIETKFECKIRLFISFEGSYLCWFFKYKGAKGNHTFTKMQSLIIIKAYKRIYSLIGIGTKSMWRLVVQPTYTVVVHLNYDQCATLKTFIIACSLVKQQYLKMQAFYAIFCP